VVEIIQIGSAGDYEVAKCPVDLRPELVEIK
jgi:hypothetical protein